MRRAGTLGEGHEWRIFGQRTLAVLPPGGKPWELSFLGRLDHRPCIVADTIVVIDELGTAYGLDANTGAQRWRRALGSAPNQDPLPSRLGVLVSTATGGVATIDPVDGQAKQLPVDARGLSLALPFEDGAVVLGGGTNQIRVIAGDGTVSRRGLASPTSRVPPHVARDGVAWIEADGVHWLGPDDAEPIHVSGLGAQPSGVTSRDGHLYAGGPDGIVRCVAIDDPTKPCWETPVGGAVTGAPVGIGDHLFVLAGGGLVVITR